MLVQAVSPASWQVQLCSCRCPCGRISSHGLSLLSDKGTDWWISVELPGREELICRAGKAGAQQGCTEGWLQE